MPRHSPTAAVQRLLFPHPGDEAALALYVRADPDAVSWSRSSLTVRAHSSASLATYFAAFPAGWWRAGTSIESVTLTGSLDGTATVRLCAADEAVGRRVITEFAADGDFSIDARLDEGTWLWLELDASDAGVTLSDAVWLAEDAEPVAATVCITTYNRVDDCIGVLERLASDEVTLAQVRRVFVVDQGTSRVRDGAGFAVANSALGDRLKVIEQANLGGSGGFSRGMIESLGEDADFILLLDDDVLLEPESARRLLAFAARARSETIVGAHMLSLSERTVLHSFGEVVERRGFWWTPVDASLAPVDLADATIESTPGLRRVRDVDFNGWWMCLVPLDLVRREGAALPLFIKWDDAEFGLRASAAGVRTVSLPGAALWHMPWTGKDDGLDWQAYYQLRNRLVTALLHSGTRRGGGVLPASFAQDVNHLLCLQYGSARARAVALRDVLRGPAHLPETIAHRAQDMRALMSRTGQIVVPEAELPAARGAAAPSMPVGRADAARRLVRVLRHQATRAQSPGDGTVEVALARAEGKWWALGLLDSAVVASAAGRGAFVARRDRRVATQLLRDSAVLRVVLWLRWPGLARAYRDAARDLTSPSAWQAIFHASRDDSSARD